MKWGLRALALMTTLSLTYDTMQAGIFNRKNVAKRQQRLKKSSWHLTPINSDCQQTRDGVTIRAKLFSREKQCVKTFSNCGKNLLRRKRIFRKIREKIYPIKITIQNDSETTVTLCPEDLGIKQAPIKQVLKRLHYKTGFIVLLSGAVIASTGIASAIFAFGGGGSMLIYTVSSSSIIGEILGIGAIGLVGAAISYSLLAIPLLVLVPPIVGITTMLKNKKNTKKVNKAPQKNNKIEIQPSKKATFFVFARESDYQATFDLALRDKQNEENVFSFAIQLPEIA